MRQTKKMALNRMQHYLKEASSYCSDTAVDSDLDEAPGGSVERGNSSGPNQGIRLNVDVSVLNRDARQLATCGVSKPHQYLPLWFLEAGTTPAQRNE